MSGFHQSIPRTSIRPPNLHREYGIASILEHKHPITRNLCSGLPRIEPMTAWSERTAVVSNQKTAMVVSSTQGWLQRL
jgi:hypothetical protein